MKYGRRMRGGDEGEVVETTSDMMADADVMADAEVMPDADMSVDQSGGKHRHSKRCKHSKKGKKSMKKRSTKKRSTKRRSTKRRSTKRRSMRKGGGVFETAAVPFGLLGLQHYFKKSSINKMSRKAKRSFTKVRKMF